MKLIHPDHFRPNDDCARLIEEADKVLCEQMALSPIFVQGKGMVTKYPDGKIFYDVLLPARFLSGAKVLSSKNDDGTFTHTVY